MASKGLVIDHHNLFLYCYCYVCMDVHICIYICSCVFDPSGFSNIVNNHTLKKLGPNHPIMDFLRKIQEIKELDFRQEHTEWVGFKIEQARK